MAWIVRRSPAAPRSTLFDDVTGSDRRHCRYGLPTEAATHCSSICSKRNTRPCLFDAAFFWKGAGQKPQFLLWYPVKAVLEPAKRGLPSEKLGQHHSASSVWSKTHNKPCGPQLSGQGKRPVAQCPLRIRTFKGIRIVRRSPRLEMYCTAQALVKAGVSPLVRL